MPPRLAAPSCTGGADRALFDLTTRLGGDAMASVTAAGAWVQYDSPIDPLPGCAEHGELRFPNGDVYRGMVASGVPCAGEHEASMRFGDGAHYRGTMRAGLFDGLGVLSTRTSIYSGEFVRGEVHGRGTMLVERLVLLGGAGAGAHDPVAEAFGAYFATARLVRVVEVAHGQFERNALCGVGGRVTSVCLVTRRDEAGPFASLLADGAAASALAGVLGGVPNEAPPVPPRYADEWRAALQAASAALRAGGDSGAGRDGDSDAVGVGGDTTLGERMLHVAEATRRIAEAADARARAIYIAPGVGERIAALADGGREVLRVAERGTWRAVAAEASCSAQSEAAARVLAHTVPVLSGDACARESVVTVLDASGSRVERRVRTYRGACLDGLAHGDGRLVSQIFDAAGTETACDTYDGTLRHGVLHGTGALTTRRSVYRGGFADDARDGAGETTRRDGTVVRGVRVRGVKEGAFVYTMPNNDVVTYEYVGGARRPLPLSVAPANRHWRAFYALPLPLQRAANSMLAGRASLALPFRAATEREHASEHERERERDRERAPPAVAAEYVGAAAGAVGRAAVSATRLLAVAGEELVGGIAAATECAPRRAAAGAPET